jgi:hypothetical protein
MAEPAINGFPQGLISTEPVKMETHWAEPSTNKLDVARNEQTQPLIKSHNELAGDYFAPDSAFEHRVAEVS